MRPHLPRSAGFAVAGLTIVGMLAAAGAPSPLYPVYQQLWGFSALTLTVVFAVYVLALLAALLTMGSLADHIGRRPVLILGLLLLAVSMVIFVRADGVGDLMLARIVQGVATGAVTGAASALVIDLQPSIRAGALVTGGAPTVGIALGVLLAGALVQYAPMPRELVYLVLCATYLVLAALLAFVPEDRAAGRRDTRRIVRSFAPSIGIAREARPTFVAVLPAIAASWALGGLYLSLGSSVVGGVLGLHNHLIVGLVLAGFFGTGGIAPILVAGLAPTPRRALGLLLLGVGVIGSVVGVELGSTPWYVVGSLLAGAGFGISFQVAFGQIAQVTPAPSRAQTFASLFVVSYTAFSVPAVVAGLAVQQWGLRPTIGGYGALDVLLVLLAALLAIRAGRAASRTRRETATARGEVCPAAE